jgi:DNA repair exonuclease SbcCD nuclease subunit
MLLLHVSDTHLGCSKPGKHRERELDFYEAFNEIIDIAVREHVDAVIHAGDFFDEPRPTPQAYYYAYKGLEKLRNSSIEVLVVAGQHDQPKTSQLPPLKFLHEIGALRLLAQDRPETHSIKLRSGELGVAAIPYMSPAVVGNYLSSVRVPEAKKRILIAHLLIKELNMPNTHASLAELSVDSFSYAALGDYHIRYETAYKGVKAVYPGSTEAVDALEAPYDRYVALVDLSSNEASVNWIKLSTPRKWVTREIDSYAQLVQILSGLGSGRSGKPPILYIKAKPNLTAFDVEKARDYLNKLVSERRILMYKIVREEEKAVEAGSEVSLAEGYAEAKLPALDHVVLNVLKDQRLAEFVLALVRSSGDVNTIKMLVEQVLNDEEFLSKIKSLVK